MLAELLPKKCFKHWQDFYAASSSWIPFSEKLDFCNASSWKHSATDLWASIKDDCFLFSVSLTWNVYLLVKFCSAYNSRASLQRNKHHCDNPPGIMQLPLIKQVSAVFQGDYHFLFCSQRAQNKREAATIKWLRGKGVFDNSSCQHLSAGHEANVVLLQQLGTEMSILVSVKWVKAPK